jgi:hypothetical protein
MHPAPPILSNIGASASSGERELVQKHLFKK